MNKTEFLTRLEERLEELPSETRLEAISYYERIIDEYTSAGGTEESAVSRLAYVDYIADEILEDPTLPVRKQDIHSRRTSMYHRPNRRRRHRLRWWELLLLILTFPLWALLALAACVLVLSFFAFCLLLTVAVYALDFGLAVLAVAALLISPIPALLRTSLSGLLLLLGIAFICGGLSILLFRAANRLAIRIMRLCKYLIYRTIAKIREGRLTE